MIDVLFLGLSMMLVMVVAIIRRSCVRMVQKQWLESLGEQFEASVT
jgi:hypothetical protein